MCSLCGVKLFRTEVKQEHNRSIVILMSVCAIFSADLCE